MWPNLQETANCIFCAVSNMGTAIEMGKLSNIGNTSHWVKTILIRCFSGPYFLAFGLNTERYGLSFRIQSKWGKIRTRKSPNTATFHALSNTKNSSNMGNINYKGNASSVVGFSDTWITVYKISNMGKAPVTRINISKIFKQH